MQLTQIQVEAEFGKFAWKESAHGAIIPDPSWVKDHIVTVKLTMNLHTQCHRKIALSLINCFKDFVKHDVDIGSFDGCYVPRHVLWDVKKPLSRHSWAIAWDTSAKQFPYGSAKPRSADFLKIIRDHGFQCGCKGGGLYTTTLDGMHAEMVLTNLP